MNIDINAEVTLKQSRGITDGNFAIVTIKNRPVSASKLNVFNASVPVIPRDVPGIRGEGPMASRGELSVAVYKGAK